MAAWLPVLKAALPYVSNIVAVALPVFTSRRGPDAAAAELVPQQITELQAAVTRNAEAVKGLAAQIEQTITALDTGEAELTQRLTVLQDAIAGCETLANQVQVQITQQDGIAALIQTQVDQLDEKLEAARRREVAIIAIGILALIVAVIALLR
jgi:chromosome segregation ATPase